MRDYQFQLSKGYKILKFQKQVVAGIKYKLTVFNNNEYREIIVWAQPNGDLKLMSNEIITEYK